MSGTNNSSDKVGKPQVSSRRELLTAGLFGGVGMLFAGGGIAASLAARPSAAHAAGPVASALGQRTGSLYMVIATPAMLGTEDPAYLPAFATVPAYARVRVEITNFDDATPLTGVLTQFASVKGTTGNTVRIEALDPSNPNQPGPTQVVGALDPNQVAHTFTIAELGINVPVAPKARTIFEIQTGAPGVFPWRCNDPCGTGTTGWGGAMIRTGFMMGALTVA